MELRDYLMFRQLYGLLEFQYVLTFDFRPLGVLKGYTNTAVALQKCTLPFIKVGIVLFSGYFNDKSRSVAQCQVYG